MCVEQEQEIVVLDRSAVLVALGEPAPGQEDAEAARERLAPFLVGHLLAARERATSGP